MPEACNDIEETKSTMSHSEEPLLKTAKGKNACQYDTFLGSEEMKQQFEEIMD